MRDGDAATYDFPHIEREKCSALSRMQRTAFTCVQIKASNMQFSSPHERKRGGKAYPSYCNLVA